MLHCGILVQICWVVHCVHRLFKVYISRKSVMHDRKHVNGRHKDVILMELHGTLSSNSLHCTLYLMLLL